MPSTTGAFEQPEGREEEVEEEEVVGPIIGPQSSAHRPQRKHKQCKGMVVLLGIGVWGGAGLR